MYVSLSKAHKDEYKDHTKKKTEHINSSAILLKGDF